MIPSILLHASAYHSSDLAPGFKRTHELVKWDDTESNEWLYAGVDRLDVLLQGYGGYMERAYNSTRLQVNGRRVTVWFDELPEDVAPPTIYLYTVSPDESDGWVPVENKINTHFKEYKTKNTVHYKKVEEVRMDAKWFTNQGFRLTHKQNK